MCSLPPPNTSETIAHFNPQGKLTQFTKFHRKPHIFKCPAKTATARTKKKKTSGHNTESFSPMGIRLGSERVKLALTLTELFTFLMGVPFEWLINPVSLMNSNTHVSHNDP